jgi:hypothetical protein
MRLSRIFTGPSVVACALLVLGLTPAGATAAHAARAGPATGSTASRAADLVPRPRVAPGLVLQHAPLDLSEVNRLMTTPQGRAQLPLFAGPNGTECAVDVAIQSHGNDKYVSAEVGWSGDRYGVLRARADQIGPWELFEECSYQNTSGQWVYTLRSQANGKLVSTEWNDTGHLQAVLRARADTEGTWEHYYMGVPRNWEMDLQSVLVGRYVSAELGWSGDDYGLLRARATSLGPWEIFGQG